MQNHKLLWTLTVANTALLIASVATNLTPARAADEGAILRGRALEIIDQRGRVRASLDIKPAGVSAAGDPFPETVLLRLITEKGRPSVKVSATESGSGLSFSGPTGTRETYVVLEAGKAASQLKLRNEGGQESISRPE